MALLTRYFQLGDAEGTEVLNFIVTKAVTRDLKRDVISKDFVFGFHRWALSFSREEKVRECVDRRSENPSADGLELQSLGLRCWGYDVGAMMLGLRCSGYHVGATMC